jgi:hypothetical protein
MTLNRRKARWAVPVATLNLTRPRSSLTPGTDPVGKLLMGGNGQRILLQTNRPVLAVKA